MTRLLRELGNADLRGPLLVFVGAALTAAALLVGGPGTALAAGTDTVTYTGTGEHSFVLPPGVTSLHVVAIGAVGGTYGLLSGGFGGKVTGDVTVVPGSTLYAEVGGSGQESRYGVAASGGGASDIRTRPYASGLSPSDPRLLVAGGGGGSTGVDRGGDAGMPGADGHGSISNGVPAEGGAAGFPAGTGAGGAGERGELADEHGRPGVLGSGGDGGFVEFGGFPTFLTDEADGGYNGGGRAAGGEVTIGPGMREKLRGGGGGGGGWYGGGGGGGGALANSEDSGGGGGGGSDLVPPGGTAAIDSTVGIPSVAVSFFDSVAPAMSLDAVPAAITGTPTFSGSSATGFGDAGVKVEVFEGPSTSGSPIRSATAERDPTTGAWNASVAAPPQGQFTVRATQEDGAHNVSTPLTSTFFYDSVPPVLSVSSPAVGADTNATLPTLSGIAGTTPRDAGTVQVTVRNVANQVVATGSGPRDGATGAYAVTTTSAIPDGIYTAFATQSDSAGNTGASTTTTFFVDTVAPTVTMSAPPAASTDPTPTFGGSGGTAPFDVRVVDVHIYAGMTPGGSPLRTFHKNLDEAANYQVTAAALPDGTYTAQASEVDAAGNVGTSPARTFTVDTTTPAVTLTSPTTGSQTSEDPTFSGVGGTAPGDPGTVTVTVRTGSSSEGSYVETLAAPRDAASGAYSASSPKALPAGTYTAVAKQTDEVGHTGTSTAETFTVVASPAFTPGGGAGTGGGVIGPARCVVPKLIAKKLKASETALKAADCKIGKVTRSKGAKPRAAKVVKQSPKTGTVLAAQAAVKVTLG
jgi:hypothetical protein